MSEAPPPRPTGLSVRDLSRRFGARWAVARVDLDVPPGSALMLTGHNGSGKTTLLRCVATALRPHHGGAWLDGADLWDTRADARARIGVLGHALQLYDDLSAADNLATWARLGGQPLDRVRPLLQRVGLDPDRADPIRTYSAGMRRRLALARVLLKRPKLLLLDEPFSAFDPDGQALVRSVVTELREQGAATLITTHVPHLAARVCDLSAHLDGGRLVWSGTAHEALARAEAP
jgi:heme exporter protein A